jgi:hypothetical protein
MKTINFYTVLMLILAASFYAAPSFAVDESEIQKVEEWIKANPEKDISIYTQFLPADIRNMIQNLYTRVQAPTITVEKGPVSLLINNQTNKPYDLYRYTIDANNLYLTPDYSLENEATQSEKLGQIQPGKTIIKGLDIDYAGLIFGGEEMETNPFSKALALKDPTTNTLNELFFIGREPEDTKITVGLVPTSKSILIPSSLTLAVPRNTYYTASIDAQIDLYLDTSGRLKAKLISLKD